MLQKPGLSPPLPPAMLRVVSPPGGSTLTTSAPRSPSSMAQKGPAITCVASSTRRPASACFTGGDLTPVNPRGPLAAEPGLAVADDLALQLAQEAQAVVTLLPQRGIGDAL